MWSIELCRIDTLEEICLLSQYLCSPRDRHIDAVYHIFIYIQNKMINYPVMTTYDLMHDPTDENVFEVSGRYLDH